MQWGQGHNTLCEAFQEAMTGCGWQGVSALDAWQRNAYRQHSGLDDAEPGVSVYFDAHPENGGYGHVGIVTGDDEFTSVTYYGVRTYRISHWVAPLLGFIRYWE